MTLAQRLERLKGLWIERGLAPQGGASLAEITTIERRLGISFPADVIAYFLVADGMREEPELTADDAVDVVAATFFWPLARVELASPGGVSGANDGCVLFADYLLCSHAYGFLPAEAGGGIVLVGGAVPRMVASSFDEFLGKYLESPYDLV